MRDPKVEQHLNDGGYVWEFVEKFELAKIDMVASLENPMRVFRKIDSDRALDIGVAIESGVDMPGIVNFEISHGNQPLTYENASGMHRIKGAGMAQVKVLDSYLVREPDPYRRDLLAATLNHLEGSAPKRAENLMLAMRLNKQHGASLDDLAKSFHIKPEMMARFRREMEMDGRCDALGIVSLLRNDKLFTQSLKLSLNRIKNDELLKRSMEAMNATGMRSKAAGELVEDILAAKTDLLRHQIITAHEEAYAEEQAEAKAKWGHRKPNIPTKMFGFMKSFVRYCSARTVAGLQLGAIEAKDLASYRMLVAANMTLSAKIDQELAKLQDQHDRKGKGKGWRPSPGSRTSGEGLRPT